MYNKKICRHLGLLVYLLLPRFRYAQKMLQRSLELQNDYIRSTFDLKHCFDLFYDSFNDVKKFEYFTIFDNGAIEGERA